MKKRCLWLLALLQVCLALRVILRMIRGIHAEVISVSKSSVEPGEAVSVIVPVLNEYKRLAPCLEGLLRQGREVIEILVVDGGSEDGTQQLVQSYMQRDRRVRLIDASPVPASWNGKAWGLQVGLQNAHPDSCWLLTIDADVRPEAALTRALLLHGHKRQLAAFSVATTQEITGIGEGLVHPALLTTLVYRYGLPGQVFTKVSQVQANGQCFLFKRKALEAVKGFEEVRASLCEDITIARVLVKAGYRVGFYETADLVGVRMYDNWQEAWQNWSRSLPMRDHLSGYSPLVGWLEVALVQAFPLPLTLFLLWRAFQSRWLLLTNIFLTCMRIGVLFGTARAYRYRPWSYWLSPLCDLPVAFQLARQALRRQHTWRGRVLIRRSQI